MVNCNLPVDRGYQYLKTCNTYILMLFLIYFHPKEKVMIIVLTQLYITIFNYISLFFAYFSCTELAGKYDEGNLSFKSAWSYIVVINNCSQVV